jgi:uncharacterized protein (TIGR00375 family)
MRQILDLHIHSKYARACSPQLTLPNIDASCRTKGIDIIATGDFTHPAQFNDINNLLTEINDTGLYKLKTATDDKIKFILSTELSLIYTDKGRCRRIHIIVHAPNISAVKELNDFLGKHYNIRSDGRPILGMKAPDLVKLCLKINPKFLIYPAHIWTPWFSVFGSKSGFDSMEECFDDQIEHIYAFETGLSSDPEMNWRVSALDKLTLLSSSDAHSPHNLGREANIFDLQEFTYNEIYNTIKNRDTNKIKSTIEFFPEEGMYHFDGHRNCQVSMDPVESNKHKGICPKCKKPLIIGVMNRVEQLADRPAGVRPESAIDYKKLVELDKIIAESLNIKSRNSKQVLKEYHHLINQAGSELHILMDADLDQLKQFTHPQIVDGIKKVRAGNLIISPGYDGQYGVIKIFAENEKIKQKTMF